MKDNYTFPAIIDYNEPGFINITFPDFLGAMTCVEVGENIISEAQDFLALTIRDYEDKCEKVPLPSENIEISDNQKLIFINVWMPYHRSKIRETYVKKTLTIPMWLDVLAKASNLNFSAILVKGLKAELQLSEDN